MSESTQSALSQISSVNSSIMRDLSGQIFHWNRAAERHYGWSKHEAVGQVSHHLLGTVFPCPLDEINDTLLRCGCWEGWLIHTLSDGRRVRVKSRWEIVKEGGSAVKVLETNRGFESLSPEIAYLPKSAGERLLQILVQYKMWWLVPFAITLSLAYFLGDLPGDAPPIHFIE